MLMTGAEIGPDLENHRPIIIEVRFTKYIEREVTIYHEQFFSGRTIARS